MHYIALEHNDKINGQHVDHLNINVRWVMSSMETRAVYEVPTTFQFYFL